ncbi:MAG: RNA methyltransferase substrate-binding domain-containing protein, partial [Vicinamibacterales bacterium]
MIIYGINSTVEALRAGTVTEIWMSAGRGQRLACIQDLARRGGVTVHRSRPAELDRLARGAVHQGVAAAVPNQGSYSVEDLVNSA